MGIDEKKDYYKDPGVKFDIKEDYYKILGVSHGATFDEIRKAYKEKARRYHPDRNPGRVEHYKPIFQDIQSAYDVLKDKQTRAIYDVKRSYNHVGQTAPTAFRRPHAGREQGKTPTAHSRTTAPKNYFKKTPHDFFRRPSMGTSNFDPGSGKASTSTPNFGQKDSRKPPVGKQGFNPRTGGGDEPKGPSNSSYNRKRRSDPKLSGDDLKRKKTSVESVDEPTGAIPKASNYRKPFVEDDSSDVPQNPKETDSVTPSVWNMSIKTALNNLPQCPSVDHARIQNGKDLSVYIQQWGNFERQIVEVLDLKQLEMETRQFDELSVEIWIQVQKHWIEAWESLHGWA